MNKILLAVLCLCFWPLTEGGCVLAAQTKQQTNFRNHLATMKIKHPREYREMVERAGGNIATCLDCHVEVAEQAKKIIKPDPYPK